MKFAVLLSLVAMAAGAAIPQDKVGSDYQNGMSMGDKYASSGMGGNYDSSAGMGGDYAKTGMGGDYAKSGMGGNYAKSGMGGDFAKTGMDAAKQYYRLKRLQNSLYLSGYGMGYPATSLAINDAYRKKFSPIADIDDVSPLGLNPMVRSVDPSLYAKLISYGSSETALSFALNEAYRKAYSPLAVLM